MSRLVDLTNRRFGRLLVVQRCPKGERRTASAIWKCVCDCGVTVEAYSPNLLTGHTQSCGCFQNERQRASKNLIHGEGKVQTAEYRAWSSMLSRCLNSRNKAYPRYGGRGIAVCPRWQGSYLQFLHDVGRRPPGKYSLDRHPDNNGNYEPGNVRWATDVEQQRNRRNNRMVAHRGVTLCVAEWALLLGMRHATIFKRLKTGWDDTRTLTVPIRTSRG